MDTIGKRFRHLRKFTKLNQKDFAEAIGVSQGTLSDIENDKFKPSVETVISASGYFSISCDWLLTGKGNGPSEQKESRPGGRDRAGNESVIEYKPPEKRIVSKDVTEDEEELVDLYRQLVNYDAKCEIREYINMKLGMQRKTRKGSSSTYVSGEEAATKMNA